MKGEIRVLRAVPGGIVAIVEVHYPRAPLYPDKPETLRFMVPGEELPDHKKAVLERWEKRMADYQVDLARNRHECEDIEALTLGEVTLTQGGEKA